MDLRAEGGISLACAHSAMRRSGQRAVFPEAQAHARQAPLGIAGENPRLVKRVRRIDLLALLPSGTEVARRYRERRLRALPHAGRNGGCWAARGQAGETFLSAGLQRPRSSIARHPGHSALQHPSNQTTVSMQTVVENTRCKRTWSPSRAC